jgi:hypothetical protein
VEQVATDPAATDTDIDHEPESGRKFAIPPRVVLLGATLAGVVGVWVATLRYGIGLTPDSVRYLDGAHSLATGAGYTANGQAITDFPPGYSWILSLGQHIGVSAIDAARLLSLVAIVATIALAYILVCRHVASEGIRVAAMAAIGCSAILLEIYEKALSEHFFVPVLLLFVLVSEKLLRGGRFAVLVGPLVLLAWAAVSLRYAGVVLIIVGALVVFVARRSRGTWTALGYAIAYGVVAGSAPLAWMIRNVDAGSGPLGPRAGASASVYTNVTRVANELSTWVATDGAPAIVRRLVLVVVLAVIAVGVGVLATRDLRTDERLAPRLPLVALVTIYGIYLVASASVVAFAAINTRLLVPIFVPIVVLVAWLYEEVRPAIRRPATRVAITGAALAWVALSVVWFAGRAVDSAQHGAGGYASARFHDSQLLRAVRTLDFSIPTFSNDAPAISFFTGKHARAGAEKTRFQSDDPLAGGIRDFVKVVQCQRHVTLVWFNPNPRPYMYDPAQLSVFVVLKPVTSSPDGVIYDVSPRGSGQAGQAGQATCPR